MPQCADGSVALTVTSPPYWNAIDYDIHARHGRAEWFREREYVAFGESFDDYLANIARVFAEVLRATAEGGFCAVVIGTLLHKGRHYPTPMLITERLCRGGWEFHQDIVWNKVTGGVKRAGVFIQHRKSGYYYPNIMTEYVLVFRKPGAPRRGRTKALDIDELFTRDIAQQCLAYRAGSAPTWIDHPCPFPEELARRLVVLYYRRGRRGPRSLSWQRSDGPGGAHARAPLRRLRHRGELFEARGSAHRRPSPPPRVQPCPALRAPRGAVTPAMAVLSPCVGVLPHPPGFAAVRRLPADPYRNRRMAGVFRRPPPRCRGRPRPPRPVRGARARGVARVKRSAACRPQGRRRGFRSFRDGNPG